MRAAIGTTKVVPQNLMLSFDDEPFLASRTYDLPELPWEIIAGRLEPITISTLRFDAASRPRVWPPVGSCAAT
jgi:hypothetical protein